MCLQKQPPIQIGEDQDRVTTMVVPKDRVVLTRLKASSPDAVTGVMELLKQE